MLRIYIWKCICLSSQRSWLAVNGLAGSALGGAIMAWQGAIQFFNESSGSLAKAASILISTVVYALPAFFAFFVLHACFISPFFVWKAEREARIDAESKINNRETRKNIRITLSRFLEDGRALMSNCLDSTVSIPIDDANAWARKGETFFRDNLDESYISRFHDDSNIARGAVLPQPSKDRLDLWHWIRVRVINLNNFIERFTLD
jgi:hypothetical protein